MMKGKEDVGEGKVMVTPKGRFPLRKISVGSDRTFFHLVLSTRWKPQMVPKAHARLQFCSYPVRSHAYFFEWKSVLTLSRKARKISLSKMGAGEGASDYIFMLLFVYSLTSIFF